MSGQKVFRGAEGYRALEDYIVSLDCKRLLLVCGSSLAHTPAGEFFAGLTERTGIEVIRFSGFSSNPDYEDMLKGVQCCRDKDCDAVCGAGGGSAMDTAKCIRLFAGMHDKSPCTEQSAVPAPIPLIAVPTTAGTGSEATHFAVIYRDGEKLSVSHESCLPEAVLLDPENLRGLPAVHRAASMLDALCHAVESMWSARADEKSRELSRRALRIIVNGMEGYLAGNEACRRDMMEAAYTAGEAINLTTTTAAHAMSYKLTKLYGIPHGHAAALCLPEVYSYIAENADRCTDSVAAVVAELPELLCCESYGDAVAFLRKLPESLGLVTPADVTDEEIELLTASVNTERLSNTPVIPDRDDIREMYIRIFRRK